TKRMYAQERTVSGKVDSMDDNFPIPGVNILIKGTTQGTVTDVDGNINLLVPSSATTIVFSFIGYQTQEVSIGEQSFINVSMQSEASTLSEVVVVGYGSVEKKDVTGGVAKVSTEEFNKGLITAPDKLIEGKVAGLQ